MRKTCAILFGGSLLLAAAAATVHATAAPLDTSGGARLILVADGCGPNGWRGPGGACHFRRGWGPIFYPGGYYRWNGGYRWNGCPPGYWRGPWGHCRDTPYHGRLPDGGWK
jgi:hypothetical protein